jgi:hypothetical protein
LFSCNNNTLSGASNQYLVYANFTPVLLNSQTYPPDIQGALNPSFTLGFYPLSTNATSFNQSVSLTGIWTNLTYMTSGSFPSIAVVVPQGLTTVPDGQYTMTLGYFNTTANQYRWSTPVTFWIYSKTQDLLISSPVSNSVSTTGVIFSFMQPWQASVSTIAIGNASGTLVTVNIPTNYSGALYQYLNFANLSTSQCSGPTNTCNFSNSNYTSLSPGVYSASLSYSTGSLPAWTYTATNLTYNPSPPPTNITVASPLNTSTWSSTFNLNVQFTGSPLPISTSEILLLLHNNANSSIEFTWVLNSSMVSNGWLNVTLPNTCISPLNQSFSSYLTCAIYPVVEDPAHIPSGTYSLTISVNNIYQVTTQATIASVVFEPLLLGSGSSSLTNLTNSSSCTNTTVNTTQYVYVNSSSLTPLTPSVVVDDSNCTITWYGMNDYVWLIIFLIIEAVVFLITLLLFWCCGAIKCCGSSYSKLG